jgi:pyridoxal phosphate enzyme (YggS family)
VTAVTTERRDEIAAGLRRVRDEIVAAAAGAGRDPADVTLVVVTKTYPVSDIEILHGLGVRDIGENRHPEAGDKAAALHHLGLVWHFIGQVQSNKAARIASYADVVHSVDSERIARRLDRGAARHGRVVTCLVQMNLDPPGAAAGRGGASERDVMAVAGAIDAAPNLRLGGLMGVAPPDHSAADAFQRLARTWRETRLVHPGATMLSAGMTADFPAAIAAGATHVRVGSAVMGERPPLR